MISRTYCVSSVSPAGRVQNAMGSTRETTAYNCFVSGIIEDSMDSIMYAAKEAAETMRRGVVFTISHASDHVVIELRA